MDEKMSLSREVLSGEIVFVLVRVDKLNMAYKSFQASETLWED